MILAVCKVFSTENFSENFADLKKRRFIENHSFKKSARHLQKKFVASRGRNNQQKKKHMSALAARGNWNIAKGKLKQKLAKLVDDDLQFLEGKEDELIGRIQKRANQTKRKIEDTARECSSCRH
jgi:uncharacterized protein YjbJ (UPF0337 family)